MTARHTVQTPARKARRSPETARQVKGPRRWLLFVHQLPSTPSNLRVSTWRRLQQLGALPVRQAVYILPDTPAAREDFEWLKTEVTAAGGNASVFAADSIDSWTDDEIVEAFRRTRREAYATLAGDIERALGRIRAARRPRGTRAPAVRRLIEVFRERLNAIEHVDFFGAAGRDRVITLLKDLEERVADTERRAGSDGTIPAVDAGTYTNRVWVTRPRPGVDRMASAWLIKRFVDPQARFVFAADRGSGPRRAIPFDMFGVEFSHRGEGCTFETLSAAFAIQQASVARIAAIVHDLDLKDERFLAPEAPTVGAVIEGMQLSIPDDDELLAKGIALFESLYRVFEREGRPAGPESAARSRTGTSTRTPQRPSRRRRSG